jgi:hypothetical protein
MCDPQIILLFPLLARGPSPCLKSTNDPCELPNLFTFGNQNLHHALLGGARLKRSRRGIPPLEFSISSHSTLMIDALWPPSTQAGLGYSVTTARQPPLVALLALRGLGRPPLPSTVGQTFEKRLILLLQLREYGHRISLAFQLFFEIGDVIVQRGIFRIVRSVAQFF